VLTADLPITPCSYWEVSCWIMHEYFKSYCDDDDKRLSKV